MPTSYSGTPVLNTSITIPVDGDNANANSVNVSSKALVDSQVLLYQVYGQLQQSTCPIRIYDNGDGKNITVQPIPNVLVTENGTWKTVLTTMATTIGVANIEGAPADYSADTWYYIYAFSDMGTCKFQISTVGSDKYNLYKNGLFSHKYLCAFKTDGAKNIIRFHKYANFYQYLTPQSIGSGIATTYTPLNSDLFIPPNPAAGHISRIGKFAVDVDAAIGNGSIIQLASDTGIVGYFLTYSSGQRTTFFVECPVDSNARLLYRVQAPSGSTTITYRICGYYE